MMVLLLQFPAEVTSCVNISLRRMFFFIILAHVKHYEDITIDLFLVDRLMIFNNTSLC